MTKTARWFDRKFDFSFEPDILPGLINRLEEFPAKLRRLFSDFPPQKLSEKPGGKWSALEQVGHLIVLEALWQTRIHEFLAVDGTTKELSPADLDNRATEEGNFNSQPLSHLLDRFAAIRSVSIGMLKEMPANPSRVLLHPRLQKPMRLVDHLFFMAEHDSHHENAIRQLGA